MENLIEKAQNVLIDIDKTSLSERLELERYLNSIGWDIWREAIELHKDDIHEEYPDGAYLYLIYYPRGNDWMVEDAEITIESIILQISEVKQYFTPPTFTLKDIYEQISTN